MKCDLVLSVSLWVQQRVVLSRSQSSSVLFPCSKDVACLTTYHFNDWSNASLPRYAAHFDLSPGRAPSRAHYANRPPLSPLIVSHWDVCRPIPADRRGRIISSRCPVSINWIYIHSRSWKIESIWRVFSSGFPGAFNLLKDTNVSKVFRFSRTFCTHFMRGKYVDILCSLSFLTSAIYLFNSCVTVKVKTEELRTQYQQDVHWLDFNWKKISLLTIIAMFRVYFFNIYGSVWGSVL